MEKKQDPLSMENLLQDYGDSGLRKIVRQAQRLLAINQVLKPYLPENCRPHCQVAQATATELTIQVDGAAWLMQLRYLKPQLLAQLKQHPQCAYLIDLQYRIEPARHIEEKITQRVNGKLSKENKELLQDTAETVSNPLLKRALMKLSS